MEKVRPVINILTYAILYIVINHFDAIGQNLDIYTVPKFQKGGQTNINKYIDSLYIYDYFFSKNKKIIINDCESGTAFVKFQIDKNATIINLNFTYNTNKHLIEIITDILYTTNKFWTPQLISGNPVDSKYIVIPIYYSFGCKKGENFPNRKEVNGVIALQNFEKPNKFSNLYNNSYEYLDCFLFPPLFISPPVP